VVAIGKHAVPARDRRGRRAGSHASAGEKHAKAGRHAAKRRARTAGAAGTRGALSSVRQRLFWISRSVRVPELGGAMIAPDPSTLQVKTRAARTPAFGIAVIVGIMFAGSGATLAGSGAQVPPVIAHKLTPDASHGLPSRVAATTAPKRLESSAYPAPPLGDMRAGNPPGAGPGPAPTVHGKASGDNLDLDTPQDVPDLQPPNDNPDLETALNELDQKADRDRAWASQHPSPPVSPPRCSPICTDSNEPGPGPELNRPPGSGAR
jgi:hypothetical protein